MKNSDYVDSYLELYKQIDKPGYAVLVRGEWGAGKTHRVLKKLGKENIYYVSLFGLTSQEEIYSSVFLSMFPAKATIPKITSKIKDALKGAEKITFAVPGVVHGLTEAFIKEKVKKDKVIVFDDLERANLDLDEILGCINKYVEHHECRVIVIAHDDSIDEKLSKVKEKIFGQILLVQPNVTETLSNFIINSRSPNVAKEIENYILPVFLASKCQSLRILKQTIDDCLRLYGCLEKKHVNKRSSLILLMSMFCGFSISFRDGKIKKEDLNERSSATYRDYNLKDTNDKSNYGKMKDRFKESNIGIEFDSKILSDDLLIDTICHGYYSKEEITSYLDSTYHFHDIKLSPAWLTLINFDKQDDLSIKTALQRIRDEESRYEIIDIGDILHTFSLKCLMSSQGEIDESIDEIEAWTKNYITKLVEINKLPESSRDARDINIELEDHSHGYGYWLRDEYRQHFSRLTKFITSCREKSLENKFPEYVKEVIESMSTDIHTFSALISSGPQSFGKYANLPILKIIPPADFVKLWLSLPRENWSIVAKTLEYRYNLGMLSNYLSDETSWIVSLNDELNRMASLEAGLARLRIERLIPKIALPEKNVANVSH